MSKDKNKETYTETLYNTIVYIKHNSYLNGFFHGVLLGVTGVFIYKRLK
jgi:hypothetical protein